MQAPPPTSQRTIQRRSPTADPGPPPNVPARAISPGNGSQSQSRSSTSSAKSGMNGSTRSRTGGQSSRDNQNNPPLSQIEKSVTHLLVATKQLLETLTQWSRHQATDAQVSDVYVRLGYEFNIACRAFTAINVDVSDLGNVPELLRDILESTLSQEASVESLEKYLPKIRDIIITLLHGLKRKQQKLRQKNSSTRDNGEASLPRNSSVSSVGSAQTGLTTLMEQAISNNNYTTDDTQDDRRSTMSNGTGVPPRGSSASSNRRGMPARDASRGSVNSEGSSISSTTMQNIPVLPPYPEEGAGNLTRPGDIDVDNFPPPPLPPKQQSALLALSRGGDLERRASRRLSAYHITKMIGSAGSLVPMPPTQNSPIPNRGRNEGARVIQNRGDHRRQQSTRLSVDTSPSRKRRSQDGLDGPVLQAPTEVAADDSPLARTPEDTLRQQVHELDAPSAILQGPPSDAHLVQEIAELPSDTNEKATLDFPQVPRQQDPAPPYSQPSPPQSKENGQFTPELSPPPGKDLTLFLKYKNRVKKFVLVGGYVELSISRLQLAFIEKFSWNTHSNGVDLPEIYIQDPVSGISHELEDLNDVKENTMLVLNVEVLDEVKRHIDQSMGGLKELVEGVKSAVDDQRITIQRVSDRQQDTSKELARISSAPIGAPRGPATGSRFSPTKSSSQSKDKDLSEMRRDIAVIRQTWNSYGSEVQKNLATVKDAFAAAKRQSTSKGLPADIKDAGRTYIASGRAEFEKTGDTLVADVDDLQDMVEDLRKDVVTRGVRPLPRQLEEVTKDISHCDRGVKKLADLVKREKPIWSKIWAKELDRICKEREILTQFEEIVSDLTDDLEKASQTFMLVEQATKEQMKDTAQGANAGRALSRGLNHVFTTADPAAAKEGVLGEVRALQPNHENRLEAIERAEKLRQKELESRRGGEFQKELGSFVEEGKLKKSGGFEEIERARKAKDERIRREVWERQNGMTQADAMAEPEQPAGEGESVGGDTGDANPPADI